MVRNAIPKSPLEAEGRWGPWQWIPPLIAVAFGLMTVLEGGSFNRPFGSGLSCP